MTPVSLLPLVTPSLPSGPDPFAAVVPLALLVTVVYLGYRLVTGAWFRERLLGLPGDGDER